MIAKPTSSDLVPFTIIVATLALPPVACTEGLDRRAVLKPASDRLVQKASD